jgi:glycosyltransferase domain-containing protein
MHRIAIIIPTMNRAKFLHRALRFYTAVRFTGTIYIADSSTEKGVLDYPKLKIVHKHYDKRHYMNEIIAWKKIMEYVKEPYACFSGDDDFIIVTSMINLANFLDSNLDFTVANGIQIKFTVLSTNEITGKIEMNGATLPHDWSAEDPIYRFCGYMRHGGSTNYHLHRTEVMKHIVQHAETLTLPAIGTELIMGCLSTLSGRFKSFNSVVSLQQTETEMTTFPRVKDKLNKVPTFFRILTHPKWPQQYELFKDIIVRRMVELGIKKEISDKIFHREFINRITTLLQEQHKQNYSIEFNPIFEDYCTYQTIVMKQYTISSKQIDALLSFIEDNITDMEEVCPS